MLVAHVLFQQRWPQGSTLNHQQVRDIAEAAFKSRFGDVDIVSISVKPGFDHYDDPKLEVRIVYDAEVERLIAPDKAPDMVRVRSEIVEKVWAAAEDAPAIPSSTSSPSPTLRMTGPRRSGRLSFAVCRKVRPRGKAARRRLPIEVIG